LDEATRDHIRPRSRGGSDDEGNLQLAHAHCNRAKANKWSPERPIPSGFSEHALFSFSPAELLRELEAEDVTDD
jgi:5-methylcytosine-specific restriction endonuclease McrA